MTAIRNTKEIKLNKLFAGIDAAVVETSFQAEKFKEVKEGAIIYQTGDESDHLYLLLRGDVKIKFLPNNYISNKIFNDFFGEKEIFDKTRRNSTAIADSKCLLYMIEKSSLEDLINKSPAIKKNIDLYGEIILPEIELVANNRIDITHKDKPVSFNAAPAKNVVKEPETNNSTEEISDTITNIIRENNPITGSNIFNMPEGKSDENIADEFNIKIDDDDLQLPDDVHITIEKEEVKTDSFYTPSNFTSIFKTLNSFQVHLKLTDTLKAIINGTKDLTSSTAGEIYLVDKNLGEMVKFIADEKMAKNVRHRISEGLTGTCLLQKKIINFDHPTEDSRFIQEIDQPGDNNLKRIIYLPLITEKQKTVAVLQLARESEPYSDFEIKQLNIIKTQAAIAIERCKKYEHLAEKERQSFNKNIELFLNDNIIIPLDLINRYSNILSKEDISQTVKAILSILQQQTNLLWDIVQSTLEYSTQDLELNLEELSINSYINNISELLTEYCDSRNINFFKKTGDDAMVRIDRGKLFMAIYQVVRNACDFSVPDSNVYISTELENDTVYINIKDEGAGIAEDMREKIFAADFSDDKGRIRLGMMIAKKIVTALNGQITFTNTTNEGTTFRISIPVYTSSENN